MGDLDPHAKRVSAGRKIMEGLQDAIAGKLVRVRMQDGSTWIPEPQWLPITREQKDGTEILAWSLLMGTRVVEWNADLDPLFPWWDAEGGHPDEAFTHWMPLPAPPAQSEVNHV